MKTNPFNTLRVEYLDIEQLLATRVDRNNELDTISSALIEENKNVLLWGERGAGKTFMLRLIEQEVLKVNGVHPVFVRLGDVYSGADKCSPDTLFLYMILIKLCREIWSRITDSNYLELLESLEEHSNEISLDRDQKKLKKIFQIAYSSARSVSRSGGNSIGFSFGAKGGKSESINTKTEFSDLMPFEISEFIKELMLIANNNSIEKFVVLCDEANNVDVWYQKEILENYFSIFHEKNIRFVFVAGHTEEYNNITYQPDSFELVVELKGFSDFKNTEEMVNKTNKGIFSFDEGSLQPIHELFEGHPRKILNVCGLAADSAIKNGRAKITLKDTMNASNQFLSELERYKTLNKAINSDRK